MHVIVPSVQTLLQSRYRLIWQMGLGGVALIALEVKGLFTTGL
jgi:hypothetical protein